MKRSNAESKRAVIIIDNIEYKQCPSYPGIYVSSHGLFITTKKQTPRPGTPNRNKAGNLTQMMCCVEGGRTLKKTNEVIKSKVVNVGRLVLDAFGIEQTYDDNGILRNEVDHIDRNPMNNELSNLRWVTHSENMKNRRQVDPIWLQNEENARKRIEGIRRHYRNEKKETQHQ